ncbi:MAG: amidase domain-containing protein [Clostridiales bacterium]|nr:amidase domain-containing protein [Clostridiales bacterium]
MEKVTYDRERAIQYAKSWALRRNPSYADFSLMGGDCTNFISQCLYAGGGVQNYTPTMGWYYNSLSSRAPAWSAARFLYRFLKANRSVGPVAREVGKSGLQIGDLIQLENESGVYHSLIVTGFDGRDPLICTHTFDAYMVPFSRYTAPAAHFMHIEYFQKY